MEVKRIMPGISLSAKWRGLCYAPATGLGQVIAKYWDNGGRWEQFPFRFRFRHEIELLMLLSLGLGALKVRREK